MNEFIPLVMLLGYGYVLYRWALAPHPRKAVKKSHQQSIVTVAMEFQEEQPQYGLWPVGDCSYPADAESKPKAIAATAR